MKSQNLMEVEKLTKAMMEILAQVAQKATRDRKAAIKKHNDKTHVRFPNFQVGDHMLVAEHRKSTTSKLRVKWKGPRRVASVESDYVFVVNNLLTKELKPRTQQACDYIRTRNSTSLQSWSRPPSCGRFWCHEAHVLRPFRLLEARVHSTHNCQAG
jgi:hypothetical protein